MVELQNMIRNYAFQHNCDFDEATYKVLRNMVSEVTANRSAEGLYDRLFGEDKKNEQQK